ncbi:hypothetical protein [Xanthovirga aplysinae]|uniref:hypothetical protein n=1 Tax=Xanthovirga aplysinae TaxID=2529853 RepID=UPI0012BCE88D|nr:hypothetical protein [Xanthovirga aplysinae]MTI30299.1 hypothetical protein [Xanthovirga aplysinae]
MKNKVGVIANIILIIMGLTLGIVFFLMEDEKKDLSIVLFSIAIGSILYQFLGGVGESNSFQLGAIKFGGTAAVLIGFMFFLKKVVFVPTVQGPELTVSPEKDWIPISTETGKIKPIIISNGKEEKIIPNLLDKSYLNARKRHEYQLSNKNASQFSIELKSNLTDTIGYVDIHNFRTRGLYNITEIAKDSKVIQVFTLYPENVNKNSSMKLENVLLPFEIKVFNTSRFSIEPFILNQEVVKRSSWLIPFSTDESYIVFLEQANSKDSVKFSKWLVEKLDHKLE